MKEKDKELDILLANKEVKIGDKTVVVHRFSLLDTVRLASHLSGIAATILGNTDTTAIALNKIMYNPENMDEEMAQSVNSIRFMGMIELLGVLGNEGADLLADLLIKGTNLTAEEIEDLDGLDGIDLLFDLYEVNKGFFTKFMSKLEKKIPKQKRKKESTVEK